MGKVSTISSIIGAISGIMLLIFMVTVYMPQSNERLEESTAKLEAASLNMIELCDKLRAQQNQVFIEYGPGTEELSYFMSSNSENFKACKEGIESIKSSCKDSIGRPTNSYVCDDPRLEYLP